MNALLEPLLHHLRHERDRCNNHRPIPIESLTAELVAFGAVPGSVIPSASTDDWLAALRRLRAIGAVATGNGLAVYVVGGAEILTTVTSDQGVLFR